MGWPQQPHFPKEMTEFYDSINLGTKMTYPVHSMGNGSSKTLFSLGGCGGHPMTKDVCSNLVFCVNLGLLALSFYKAKWQNIAGFKHFFTHDTKVKFKEERSNI